MFYETLTAVDCQSTMNHRPMTTSIVQRRYVRSFKKSHKSGRSLIQAQMPLGPFSPNFLADLLATSPTSS